MPFPLDRAVFRPNDQSTLFAHSYIMTHPTNSETSNLTPRSSIDSPAIAKSLQKSQLDTHAVFPCFGSDKIFTGTSAKFNLKRQSRDKHYEPKYHYKRCRKSSGRSDKLEDHCEKCSRVYQKTDMRTPKNLSIIHLLSQQIPEGLSPG